MSTQVNQTLTDAEQIFKDVVWDPLFAAGQVWLIANVPVFSLPVISQMEKFAVSEMSSYAFSLVKEFIDIQYVKLKNAAAQSAWDKASVTLAVLAHDKGIDSDEFKKARDDAKAALSNLLRYSV